MMDTDIWVKTSPGTQTIASEETQSQSIMWCFPLDMYGNISCNPSRFLYIRPKLSMKYLLETWEEVTCPIFVVEVPMSDDLRGPLSSSRYRRLPVKIIPGDCCNDCLRTVGDCLVEYECPVMVVLRNRESQFTLPTSPTDRSETKTGDLYICNENVNPTVGTKSVFVEAMNKTQEAPYFGERCKTPVQLFQRREEAVAGGKSTYNPNQSYAVKRSGGRRTKLDVNNNKVNSTNRNDMKPAPEKLNNFPKEFCRFCQSNREPRELYTSHVLRNRSNDETLCPILRMYVCPVCYKTEGEAHTLKYCPLIGNRNRHVYRKVRNAAGKLGTLKF